MATMNISMPDTLREYVENRVTRDGYGNISEYFRELVRLDQKRKAEEETERHYLEKLKEDVQFGLDALRSGKFSEYDSAEELFNQIRREGNNRIELRKSGEQK